MTVAEAITRATPLLASAGIDIPRLDAQLILAWVLKARREDLAREPERVLDWREQTIFDKAVDLRSKRRPLAYITGEAWFYGRPFTINKAVLIPRPETEILVEEALKRIKHLESPRIADICTGSGCIGVTLACERPDAEVWLTDIERLALMVATKNCVRQRIEDRTHLMLGDLFAPLSGSHQKFDVIISNPPYVRPADVPSLQPVVRDYEPRIALVGELDSVGIDGVELHRRLLAEALSFLAPEGWILLEMGQGQAETLKQMAESAAYRNITMIDDLAGIPRVLAAMRPQSKDRI